MRRIVSDPTFVSFDSVDFVHFTTAYLNCDIIEITTVDYLLLKVAYPITKGSQFKELFMYQLQRLKESGILAKLDKKYRAPPQICPSLSGRPLGFGQTFTAFIVMSFGIVGGLFILA